MKLDQQDSLFRETLKLRRRAMGAGNRARTKSLAGRSQWLYPFQYERKYFVWVRKLMREYSTRTTNELRNNLNNWVEEQRIDECLERLEIVLSKDLKYQIPLKLDRGGTEGLIYKYRDIYKWDEILDSVECDREQIKEDVLKVDAFINEWDSFVDELRVLQNDMFGEDGQQTGNTVAFISDLGHDINEFNQTQFQKFMRIAIGDAFITDEPWVQDTLNTWEQTNFELVKGLTDEYIKKVNTIVTNGVQSGALTKDIMKEFRKMDINMSVKRTRLLARDQVGKLNGILTKNRQQTAGIEMYNWLTAGDERVRGNPSGRYPNAIPSHFAINGALLRWDDNTVYSKDGGKTWIKRPASWPQTIPGNEIQCRCSAIPYFDSIIAEIDEEIEREAA